MRRLLHILIFSLCAALTLCACGMEEKVELIVSPTSTPALVVPATPVQTDKAEYNTLDSADESETDAVSAQLLKLAEACQDIYAAAEKGATYNVVLSSAVVRDMVTRIGEQGCSAIDAEQTMDMQCPQPLQTFGEELLTGSDAAATYYLVYGDGQISAYHLSRSSGKWYLIAMSAVWDNDATPRVSSEGRYAVSDVKYTDKGWLIYSRDTTGFDVNQRTNTTGYTLIRVTPYDSTMRALCQQYVEPVGYFENNLFTTSWSEANLIPIDFNSLYSQLFGMYNGTEDLSAGNEANFYSPLQNTAIFVIPTAIFEKTVQRYFKIDSATLKSISDYSAEAGGYLFLGYRDGYYNVTPRTPEPEVTEYHYNKDGTLTMRVDAVNRWYGSDIAFTHELTVRINADGSFRYVSNVFYEAETNIIPERRLSYLLDIERSKTDY